jgi:hypothetical protein
MSSTGGGVIVAHKKLRISGPVSELKKLAETTTDPELKTAILEAVNAHSTE